MKEVIKTNRNEISYDSKLREKDTKTLGEKINRKEEEMPNIRICAPIMRGHKINPKITIGFHQGKLRLHKSKSFLLHSIFLETGSPVYDNAVTMRQTACK